MPLQPDKDEILVHLGLLFEGAHPEALIEICWTDPTGALSQARLFPVRQLDQAANEAIRWNAQGRNVYVGVNPRMPDTPAHKRASDKHVLEMRWVWCDWDLPGTSENAQNLFEGMPPLFRVYTGRHPHVRSHGYWRLTTPLTPDEFERGNRLLHAMAVEMNGDPQVRNPSRVLRIAGSVAHPMKEGRIPEMTEIWENEQALASYEINRIERRFPNDTGDDVHAPAVDQPTHHITNTLGIQTVIDDGRESYMRDTVLACLSEYIGTTGAVPTAPELYGMVWPQYEQHVDWQRPPQRGPDEVANKCLYTLRRFEHGEIEGMRNLDEAVAAYKAKQPKTNGSAGPHTTTPEPVSEPLDYFPASDFIGEPEQRRWLVKEWIPAGTVSTLAGDGGVGKTLLVQQLIYAASIGDKWLGMDVMQCPALGVLCEDERGELHRRHQDIASMNGHLIPNPYRNAYLWPRVGRNNLLLSFDRNHVPQAQPFYQQLDHALALTRAGLLALDTVADIYGGNEIDRAQVNYFIKAICGGLILSAAERGTLLTILLLSHPSLVGRNTGTGESGSTAWNNAVRSRMYLTKPEGGLKEARLLTRKKSNYATAGDDEMIELLWCNGTLQPTSDGTTNNERLLIISAKQYIVRAVKEAWDAGTPYKGKRTGKAPKGAGGMFLDARMMDQLRVREFNPLIIAAALNAVKAEGLIHLAHTRALRGWAPAGEGTEEKDA